ncbi:hypothetical protein LOTGIDRAFT_176033 [Lottia gigantea]|uniref:Uncharacterized protein n=1 Tax=Lottia gigantea TaxID=225164 RepID=V3ZU61_LOTGI|nr:hypothetical protein LOTGIDRAFT_176033 [Lottia gigantea]ESO86125.1 hypothetical protein LOTGIDRAFT_176033 [Lottia gigantea]
MSKSSIEEYLKESVKSYQACHVKNSARRSSLQKKTEGIEMARKKMTTHMEREEKLLRRQLSNMQLDQIRREMTSPLLEVRRSESLTRQRTRKISSITSRELQAGYKGLILEEHIINSFN